MTIIFQQAIRDYKMDAEKSSNSSFEDLSTLNENELKEAQQSMDNANSSKSVEDTPKEEDLDILGNGQLTKRVSHRCVKAQFTVCLSNILLGIARGKFIDSTTTG